MSLLVCLFECGDWCLLVNIQTLDDATIYTPPHCLHFERYSKRPRGSASTSSSSASLAEAPNIHVHIHNSRDGETTSSVTTDDVAQHPPSAGPSHTRRDLTRTSQHNAITAPSHTLPPPAMGGTRLLPINHGVRYPSIDVVLRHADLQYPSDNFPDLEPRLLGMQFTHADDITFIAEDAVHVITGIPPRQVRIIFDIAERMVRLANASSLIDARLHDLDGGLGSSATIEEVEDERADCSDDDMYEGDDDEHDDYDEAEAEELEADPTADNS